MKSHNYPEFFYFFESDSQSHYRSNPPGNLNFPRMLNCLPCWETNLSNMIPKQKTLVLADWTFANATFEKIEETCSLIEKWIADGFTVYAWQCDQPILLTKESIRVLHDEKVREKMTLTHIDEILKKIVKHYHIPIERLQVIDDHILSGLVDDQLSITRPRILNLSDYLIAPKKVEEIFFKRPPFPWIIHNQFDEKTNVEAKKLIDKGRKVIKQYSIFHFEKAQDILKIVEENKALTLGDENLFLKDLNNAKRLSIKQSLRWNDLKKICESLPQLRYLSVHLASSRLTDNFTLNTLPNLRELHFSDENPLPSPMDSLFSATTSLKKYITDQPLEAIETSLRDLIELELLDEKLVTINDSFIERLIKVAPNLKKLILPSNVNEFFLFDFYGKEYKTTNPFEELDVTKCHFKYHKLDEVFNTLEPYDWLGIIINNLPDLKKIIINAEQYSQIPKNTINTYCHLIEVRNDAIELNNNKKFDAEPFEITQSPVSSTLIQEPEDHVYDLEELKNFKPNKNNFQFFGDKQKNQTLFIEKLCQYWILTDDPKIRLIPKIQDGICNAMTYLFIEKYQNWNNFIEPILSWDGSEKELKQQNKNLEEAFSILSDTVTQHQFIARYNNYYIGNDVSTLLKNRKPLVLCNTWHAIAIVPMESTSEEKEMTWMLYDSDSIFGPKKQIVESKLNSMIENHLGKILELRLPLNEDPPIFSLTIPSVNNFIGVGGLLLLTQVKNQKEILDILVSQVQPLSEEGLDGLFIRGSSGKPAWVCALEYPDTVLSNYTFNLLQQYITLKGIQPLKDSLVNMSPLAQHNVIELLQKHMRSKLESEEDPNVSIRDEKRSEDNLENNVNDKENTSKETSESNINHEEKKSQIKESDSTIFILKANDDLLNNEQKQLLEKNEVLNQNKITSQLNALINEIHTNPTSDFFEKSLATWERKTTDPESLLEYTKQLIIQAPEEKNILIQLKSGQAVKGLSFSIQKICNHTSRPVFYIDSPEDLICSNISIERTGIWDDGGVIKNPPAGPLYEFLRKNQDKAPILIVNYDHFTYSDMVRFNSLLDKEPNADGELLPLHTKVIGLMNINKPDCYQGSDFYSRIDRKEEYPLP